MYACMLQKLKNDLCLPLPKHISCSNGSPLGPVLANLFMEYNEENWVGNYKGNKPRYYERYADDIFVCVRNSLISCLFLSI